MKEKIDDDIKDNNDALTISPFEGMEFSNKLIMPPTFDINHEKNENETNIDNEYGIIQRLGDSQMINNNNDKNKNNVTKEDKKLIDSSSVLTQISALTGEDFNELMPILNGGMIGAAFGNYIDNKSNMNDMRPTTNTTMDIDWNNLLNGNNNNNNNNNDNNDNGNNENSDSFLDNITDQQWESLMKALLRNNNNDDNDKNIKNDNDINNNIFDGIIPQFPILGPNTLSPVNLSLSTATLLNDELDDNDNNNNNDNKNVLQPVPQHNDNIPQIPIPSIPSMPSIPTIPTIPTMPNIPNLPNIAGIPSFPPIPNLTKMSGIPPLPPISQLMQMPSNILPQTSLNNTNNNNNINMNNDNKTNSLCPTTAISSLMQSNTQNNAPFLIFPETKQEFNDNNNRNTDGRNNENEDKNKKGEWISTIDVIQPDDDDDINKNGQALPPLEKEDDLMDVEHDLYNNHNDDDNHSMKMIVEPKIKKEIITFDDDDDIDNDVDGDKYIKKEHTNQDKKKNEVKIENNKMDIDNGQNNNDNNDSNNYNNNNNNPLLSSYDKTFLLKLLCSGLLNNFECIKI